MKFKKFNWKLAMMRMFINGAAIALTALILPGISITQPKIVNLLILGAAFGVLNAVVKPVVQFLTLSLIFVTYGLVVIIINTIMMIILAFLFQGIITVNSLLAAIIGGTFVSLFGLLLEAVFGAAMPIVDDMPQSVKGEEARA